MTTDDIITGVLKREGKFVNNPHDKGGPTNWGITQDTLERHRGAMVTEQDVESMTEAEARAIYKKMYVEEPGFTLIYDDRLRTLMVDAAVNHGVDGAVRMLQRALKVSEDGILGSETLGAIKDANQTYYRMCAERVRKYGRIITKDHSQAIFAYGWANRIAEFVES